jgi:hypothetical protein
VPRLRANHRRPQDVPWEQHAIGCSLRGRLCAAMQFGNLGLPPHAIVE